MTPEQFVEKVEELADVSKKDMLLAAGELLRSGAVDLEAYQDSYTLPKLFMIAYASRLERQWTPNCALSKKQKSEVRNIKVFI